MNSSIPTAPSAPLVDELSMLLPLQLAAEGGGRETKRHKVQLWSWWSLAVALECFAAVAMTVFLPLALEQSARRIGFVDLDRTQPCPLDDDPNSASPSTPGQHCRAPIAFFEVDSASWAMYTYSASVFVQALLVISLSKIADHPAQRKRLLLAFAAVGSSAGMLFPALQHPALLGVLAVISVASFGSCFVMFNSYLPDLGRGGKSVVEARWAWQQEATALFSNADGPTLEDEPEGAPLLSSLNSNSEPSPLSPSHISPKHTAYLKALSLETSRISLIAVAIGYLSGCTLLLPSLGLVTALDGSFLSLRLAVALSAGIWALGTVPAAWFLGSTKRGKVIGGREAGDGVWTTEVLEGWRELGRMLRWKEMARLNNTFFFLLAWVFLSDAASTFSSTAIIFAKTALQMSSSQVIVVAILAQASGVLSAFSAPPLQARVGWSNKTCLVFLTVLMGLLPVYGSLGLLSGFPGGLKSPTEMYVVATLFGLVFGPLQSFARTVFSELVPPGKEARFFGLYSITDKSSSFFGPAIVGLIADSTGDIRFAFPFLLAMLCIPIPVLLLAVDVDAGRQHAAKYALEVQGVQSSEIGPRS